MNLYNENEHYAATWLRKLVNQASIPYGYVAEEDIQDLLPDVLNDFTQCHFFAGIGVWPYALQVVGWPEDRPIWTASCPCQPFSTSGYQEGFDDERHLWPALYWLILQRRPPIIVGEQVAGTEGLRWFDTVQSDLAVAGYAVCAALTTAGGTGAPHIRQRLYFAATRLADPDGDEPKRLGWTRTEPLYEGGVWEELESSGRGTLSEIQKWSETNAWGRCEWLEGSDGLWRPAERGTFPLSYGTPKRVEQLRAHGNGLVVSQAAFFLRAIKEMFL